MAEQISTPRAAQRLSRAADAPSESSSLSARTRSFSVARANITAQSFDVRWIRHGAGLGGMGGPGRSDRHLFAVSGEICRLLNTAL
jgi:hypothetical protein